MKKLLAVLEQVLAAGQDAVLVTVIASSGSTPRGAGARMLVTDRGWACLLYTSGAKGRGHLCRRLPQRGGQPPPRRPARVLLYDLGGVTGGETAVQFHLDRTHRCFYAKDC